MIYAEQKLSNAKHILQQISLSVVPVQLFGHHGMNSEWFYFIESGGLPLVIVFEIFYEFFHICLHSLWVLISKILIDLYKRQWLQNSIYDEPVAIFLVKRI